MTDTLVPGLSPTARLQFLSDAGDLIGASLDSEATLAGVSRLAVSQLADLCVIHIVEPEGAIRAVAIAHADPSRGKAATALYERYPPNPLADHGVSKVLRTGETEVVAEILDGWLARMTDDEDHVAPLGQLDLKSYICAPLICREHVLGTLTLAMDASGRRFAADDIEFVETVARRTARAVDNGRLYREALEASRLKNELVSRVSHELRTSLMVTLGWTAMLRASRLQKTILARALAGIERNAQTQTQLVETIVDAADMITNAVRLETQPVDLVAVIADVLDASHDEIDAKRLVVHSVLPEPPVTVQGDSDRLYQIVRHLLDNAIKFTPDGGRIELTLDTDKTQAQLRISDSGRGIGAEFLPYLFDWFRQETTTRQGMGVRLAIARHLVVLHGGSVKAASAGEGRGATFTVTLPLAAVAMGSVTTDLIRGVQPIQPNDEHALHGARVLLVDDERDARELLTEALEHHGAMVIAVASAQQALAIIQRVKIDVLVSDIGMPGEDGFTLIRRIRALDDGVSGVPAIALTAYGSVEHRTRALVEGYQAHVTKPVQLPQLAGLIGTLLHLRVGSR